MDREEDETMNVKRLGFPVGRSLEPVRHLPILIVGKRLEAPMQAGS